MPCAAGCRPASRTGRTSRFTQSAPSGYNAALPFARVAQCCEFSRKPSPSTTSCSCRPTPQVLPREVSLGTQLTRGIRLNLPIVSAAMDTVTEHRLAITIAQEGGIGIIHKNMTIEAQAREVARVKKFESGIIHDPITVAPEQTIREVLELTRSQEHLRRAGGARRQGRRHRHAPRPALRDALRRAGVGGHDAAGAAGHRAREARPRKKCWRCCTSTASRRCWWSTTTSSCKGMITVKDFQKATEFPRACKDERGALRVGAAVGTGADTLERVGGAARERAST